MNRALPRAVKRAAIPLIALAILAAACTSVDRREAGAPTTDPPAGDDDTTDPGEPVTPDRTRAELPEVAAPDPDPTPLSVDTDVRIGTLDNGLTYYLRENDAPGSSLDLRLVVDAGSLHQEVAASGAAHFLEHMLFNGTEQFPGNELDRSLQRLGIQFGPELNAFTSYDETVYLLEATTLDPEAVEIAFDVLAQWASAATLAPGDVDDEKGVVVEELRTRRGTSDGIVAAAFSEVYTAGTPYQQRDPIGTEAEIEATTAPSLRTYYDRWYRPDTMAVVVVGDLPVDRMEQEIRERFDPLVARDPSAPPQPDRTIEVDAEATAHVVTHPDQVVDNLSFDIPLTSWDTGTVGGERLTVMEALVFEMVLDRIEAAVEAGDLAIVSAPYFFPFWEARELRYAGTNVQADDLEGALGELMGVLLGVAFEGFGDDDLAAAKESYVAGLDAMIERLATRQDREWADDYMIHFLGGQGIDRIEATVDRQRDLLDELTVADLTDHWRWILRTGGPIVIAVGADEDELPTPERMLEIVDGATSTTTADTAAEIDRLMDRPDAVDPVESSVPSGAFTPSSWTFDNGVRVLHIESDINAGLVDLRAIANGGWSTLAPGTGAITDSVTSAVDGSGHGDVDRSQIDRLLAGADVRLVSFIDETEEGFTGFSATDDTELLFQLLHLAVTAPRADDTAVAVARNDAENFVARAETDPETRSLLELIDARTGSSPAYVSTPTPEQLDALDATTILDIYESRLGDVDDLVVAIVGDIPAEEVEELARHYLGTLPSGGPDSWTDRLPPMPDSVIRRVVELDDDITAAGIDVLYSTDRSIDPELEITARVLETILTTRILETVREELGATYGGTATIIPTRRPRESVDVWVDIDGDPDRLDTILATVDTQISELVTDGPSADEFERAVAVLADDYEFVNNEIFLTALLDEAHFPDRDVLWPGDRATILASVDAEDVQGLAAELLPADQRIEVFRTTS